MKQQLPSLKWLAILKPVFHAFQIDYPMLRKIVQMKFMMDQRRIPTIFNNQTKKQKGNQLVKSLGMYVLYSLILIPLLFLDHYFFQMSIIFGISIFILMTSMISDFSTVLLDIRDQNFLHTKPISTRTVNAAKLLHVSLYMAMITGAFLALPAIFALYIHGFLFAILFICLHLLLVMFIITLTALAYIIILRFFSGEQLKDFINYVQIILSISVIIGYQIVIRSFDMVDVSIAYVFQWWHLLIPPLWFAAPFEFILNDNTTNSVILLACLALVIPILSLIIYFQSMPTFEKNLQKLMEETKVAKEKKRYWTTLWEALLCRNKEERSFFRFANAIMGKEREFKLKVYPSLGLAVVFPFIFIFSELRIHSFEEIGSGNMYFNIYFMNLMIGTIVYMLQYSGNYQGAWIFKAAPIKNPLLAYSGALKAFITRLYLPVFFTISIAFLFIFSYRIIPDLIVVLLTALLHTLICYKIMVKTEYPFSTSFQNAQQGSNGVFIIFLLLITGVFAGVHFLFQQLSYGVYIYMFLLVITIRITWKWIFYRRHKGDTNV